LSAAAGILDLIARPVQRRAGERAAFAAPRDGVRFRQWRLAIASGFAKMRAATPTESKMHIPKLTRSLLISSLALASFAPAAAQSDDDEKLVRAAEVLRAFTADDDKSIPADLLQRARGIAVIPTLIRGGFFIGGRRGRGVLAIRGASGEWSNPAFITLTGGNLGLQFGAEAEDVVLVFANDRSVSNIASGKFTLGGDATAIAGPMGKRTTAAVTGKSEVYIYARSRGLYAGASFEGARLDVDEEGNAAFYSGDERAALGPSSASTPPSAARYLETLRGVALSTGVPATTAHGATPHGGTSTSAPSGGAEQAIIYPIEEAPQ
jgi:lipid-binding SYLF domain-containing protein